MIDKTVYYYAIKAGADPDEAERIAIAVAEAKSKTWRGKCLKVLHDHSIKFLIAIAGAATTAAAGWVAGIL